MNFLKKATYELARFFNAHYRVSSVLLTLSNTLRYRYYRFRLTIIKILSQVGFFGVVFILTYLMIIGVTKGMTIIY